MHKFGSDPKVKKTLNRNCEKKVKPADKKQAIHDVGTTTTSNIKNPKSILNMKENELNHPTMCSSEALANYLSDAKISAPSPLNAEDLNVNKTSNCAKVTKKLNFHFNDRIYRNLIELNAIVDDPKKRKEKRPLSSTSTKKDLEPNLEDFYEDIIDEDSCPDIPIARPKFKTVKPVENGHLHKLVAAFEDL